VIELGGGLGFVAAAMMNAAAKAQSPLHYTFLELSPVLARAQRAEASMASSVRGHAEALPFADRSVRGLFLANEVIADLRVCPVDSKEGRAWLERFSLPGASGPLLNAGALAFVVELARVLAPGSAAMLTEFGGSFPAAPVRLEGSFGRGRHVEHSIQFEHLEAAAAQLGLETERMLLAELLGVNRELRVASYPDIVRLRRFVPSLPVLAWPKEELEKRHPLLTRFFRFDFPTIGSPAFPDPTSQGGFCQLFHTLTLRQKS
jgi:hypothetical protein